MFNFENVFLENWKIRKLLGWWGGLNEQNFLITEVNNGLYETFMMLNNDFVMFAADSIILPWNIY